MRPQLSALAMALGLAALAPADALACKHCGQGKVASAGGPGHVVATQGTFVTGAEYAAAPAPASYAPPASAPTPQAAAYATQQAAPAPQQAVYTPQPQPTAPELQQAAYYPQPAAAAPQPAVYANGMQAAPQPGPYGQYPAATQGYPAGNRGGMVGRLPVVGRVFRRAR